MALWFQCKIVTGYFYNPKFSIPENLRHGRLATRRVEVTLVAAKFDGEVAKRNYIHLVSHRMVRQKNGTQENFYPGNPPPEGVAEIEPFKKVILVAS